MILQSAVESLTRLSDGELLLLFWLENCVLFVLSALIGMALEYKVTIFPRRDTLWIVSTMVCNTIITYIGYKLYVAEWVVFDFSVGILRIVFDIALIMIAMDLLMYLFHWGIHQIKWLYPIHAYHHRHVETTVYSLFVLHPIETFGFGFLWLFLLILYPFNAIAIVAYLSFNLLYGILGHVRTDIFPDFWVKNRITKLISTTNFHHTHHTDEKSNFGFYFTVWDRVFRTESHAEKLSND